MQTFELVIQISYVLNFHRFLTEESQEGDSVEEGASLTI